MSLLDHLPRPPHWQIDWSALDERYEWVRALSGCPQSPEWHAEGDVWIHTRMVLEAVCALPAFRALQELVSQQILPTPRCIVIADASGPEINAAVNVLRNLRNEHGQPVPLLLATAETFGAYAVQLAAAFQPPPPTTAPS